MNQLIPTSTSLYLQNLIGSSCSGMDRAGAQKLHGRALLREVIGGQGRAALRHNFGQPCQKWKQKILQQWLWWLSIRCQKSSLQRSKENCLLMERLNYRRCARFYCIYLAPSVFIASQYVSPFDVITWPNNSVRNIL